MPAVRDTGWRLLLAAGTLVLDAVSAAYILGALCAVLTLLVLLRLARLLFPFPPFMLYACALLIVGPQFLWIVLSGTALPLATLLITLAVMLHVEGLQGRRQVLPMMLMICVAFAAWIRIEFVLLWVLLPLHALCVATGRTMKAGGFSRGQVVLRWILGVLVLALLLLPLIGWNAYYLRVPWPRPIDAPLALDVWARGPANAVRESMALVREMLPSMYAEFYRVPFLGGWIQRVFFWFGCLVLIALGAGRVEERPFTVLVAIPVVLPVLYALVFPYVGPGGVRTVFGAFYPLAALLAAYGFFRIPFLLEYLHRRWKEGLPTPIGFNTWWVTVGAIFLVATMVRSAGLLNKDLAALRSARDVREQLVRRIGEEGLMEGVIATDMPGWVAHRLGIPFVDLTGEGSPDILRTLDRSGCIDGRKLTDLLRKEKVSAVLLWTTAEEPAWMKQLNTVSLYSASIAERAETVHLYRLMTTSGGF